MKAETTENFLDIYRVLDLTDERGLRCGSVLGGLGADVLQVEPPEGNTARQNGPFYQDRPDRETSLEWFAECSNKKSITLNIEAEAGREIFRKLARKADFVIESFSPGYLDELGLGFRDLHDLNPRLVMTSITPFGSTGPYRDYKTSDLVAMGMGGIMSVCGDADRPPVRVSTSQAFKIASVHAAAGTLIAHYWRRLTGEGQHVDCSIHESIAWMISVELAMWQFAAVDSQRAGVRRSRTQHPPLSIYPCKDGYVAFWLIYGSAGRRIKPLVDWMHSVDMAGPLKGVADWTQVDANELSLELQTCWEETFATFFRQHTKAELFQEALKRGFILCPSRTIKDLVESPQLAARQFWDHVYHPDLDTTLVYAGDPYKFSGGEQKTRWPAPHLGEHNCQIYRIELGLSEQEMGELRREGVV